MLLAINKRIIDKNILGDKKANAEGWENIDPTPKELASLIKAGFAFCPQLNGGYRKGSNFECAGYIAADIDIGMTLEEALAHDFVTQHASILYTTPSHTMEANRFRIVFELETPITDPEKMRWAMSGIGKKFNGDPVTKDACRMFYGSRGCQPTVLGHILPNKTLDEIVEVGKTPRHLSDGSLLGNQRGVAVRSTRKIRPDEQVIDRNGQSYLVTELPERTPVFCPFHLDNHPSAFVVKSQKGAIGVHCSSCNTTFWVDAPRNSYNFYRMDEVIREGRHGEMQQVPEFEESTGTAIWQTFFDLEKDPWNIVVNDRFLPKVPVSEGLTFIKSPKGTGKTEFLKTLISKLKKEKKRILLVGHRQLLLHDIAHRLGLDCYLYNNRAINPATKHYAISVDSLANDDLISPMRHKYDAVIIDESEQVFSHFVSDTLRDKRRLAYFVLKHYLSTASIIVALDADLNAVTLEAAVAMAPGKSDVRLVLNEYQNEGKSFDLYGSDKHLLSDLFEAISRGERCYVASNSKEFIDKVYESIKARPGIPTSVMRFTSENSMEEETIDNIRRIKTRILEHQVTLASPTLGTGVDISFDDKQQHVDGVYGFFQARINTHFDIDQQLSRVRDPRYVKVWISPENFNFETEDSVILNELIQNRVLPELMDGFAADGSVIIDEDDPFLSLYACVLAAQRASKNDLKDNFIELKKRNGWTINLVEKDEDKAEDGSEIASEGKALRLKKRIDSLMAARILPIDEYEERRRQERNKQHMSRSDRLALERAKIERFYNQTVTPELIEEDDEGRLRGQVLEFEGVFQLHIPSKTKAILGKSTKVNVKKEKRSVLLGDAIKSAGLIDSDKKPSFDHITNTSTLDDFVQFCKKRKPTIERVLALQVRKDLSRKPMTQLQSMLHVVGLQMERLNPIRSGTDKIYQYRLDPDQWSKMLNISKGRHERTLPEPVDEVDVVE